MGKPTGFKEFERQAVPYRDPNYPGPDDPYLGDDDLSETWSDFDGE